MSQLESALPALKTPQKAQKSLGELIAVYRYQSIRWRWRLAYIGLSIAAVAAPLIYAVQRYLYGYAKHGEAAALIWSRPWFILAGFALLTALLLLVYRLRVAHRFVAVHKHGVMLALSVKQAYRWEQINGIAAQTRQDLLFGISLKPRYRAVLFPNFGKPIRISDAIENLPDLLSRIKANLYPRLMPVLKEQFLAGKWIYFGPLAIQRKYLRIRKSQYLWSQVAHIQVEQGYLVINLRDHPRQRLAIGQIPNWELFLQLVNMGATA